MLELEGTAGGLAIRFAGFFLFTGLGERQAQRLPIGGACRVTQAHANTPEETEKDRDGDGDGDRAFEGGADGGEVRGHRNGALLERNTLLLGH